MTRARTNRHAGRTETRTTSARIDIYDPSPVRRIFHERAGSLDPSTDNIFHAKFQRALRFPVPSPFSSIISPFPPLIYLDRNAVQAIFNLINQLVWKNEYQIAIVFDSCSFRIHPLFPILFFFLKFLGNLINFHRWRNEEGEEGEERLLDESTGWLLTEFWEIKWRGWNAKNFVI